MYYVTLLERLHAAIRPNAYLEIGVAFGQSLGVSRARSIGIDPFAYPEPPAFVGKPWIKLFREPSDDFFRAHEPDEILEGYSLDLAFIDGYHEFTQVVRDLENIERWGHPGTIVVIDDVVPRNAWEASRAPHDGPWTGDVWRIVPFLRDHRPDLRCILVDVWEAGALIVADLNPRHPGMAEAAAALNVDFPGDGPDYDRQVEGWLAEARPLRPEEALRALTLTPAVAVAEEAIDGHEIRVTGANGTSRGRGRDRQRRRRAAGRQPATKT